MFQCGMNNCSLKTMGEWISAHVAEFFVCFVPLGKIAHDDGVLAGTSKHGDETEEVGPVPDDDDEEEDKANAKME